MQGRQSYLRDYRQQTQDLNRDVTNEIRGINQEAPNIYRGILNNAASRGMAYSSGYGYNYGQAQNQITNQKANLSSALNIDLNRMREDKERAMAQYQYNLANIMQQQAQGAEKQAGNLGFDRPKQRRPAKKKIKRRPRRP